MPGKSFSCRTISTPPSKLHSTKLFLPPKQGGLHSKGLFVWIRPRQGHVIIVTRDLARILYDLKGSGFAYPFRDQFIRFERVQCWRPSRQINGAIRSAGQHQLIKTVLSGPISRGVKRYLQPVPHLLPIRNKVARIRAGHLLQHPCMPRRKPDPFFPAAMASTIRCTSARRSSPATRVPISGTIWRATNRAFARASWGVSIPTRRRSGGFALAASGIARGTKPRRMASSARRTPSARCPRRIGRLLHANEDDRRLGACARGISCLPLAAWGQGAG
jgi:hypothetical protein